MAGFSREVARRVFVDELRNSNLAFRDSEDQYAPQYLLTPTGAKCNRIFLVGTLTERDDIGGDTEYWRGRIVDPTGSILIYAGRYDPDAAQIMATIEPPAFVAVVGKPKIYQPEDGSVIVNVRAEAIRQVDEVTRDRWILDTARRTQERLAVLESTALVSLSNSFTTADRPTVLPLADSQKARQHYSTDIKQYRQMILRALSSLRADLGHGHDVGAIRVEESRGDSGQEVNREDAEVTDAADVDDATDVKLKLEADSRNASDSPKIKPEVKSDPPKKTKSKTSSAKASSLTGFSDSAEQDDVETIPVFKKG
jgi:RPA family protein